MKKKHCTESKYTVPKPVVPKMSRPCNRESEGVPYPHQAICYAKNMYQRTTGPQQVQKTWWGEGQTPDSGTARTNVWAVMSRAICDDVGDLVIDRARVSTVK